MKLVISNAVELHGILHTVRGTPFVLVESEIRKINAYFRKEQ